MRQESKYKVLWEIVLTKPSFTGWGCLTSVCLFFVCFCEWVMFLFQVSYWVWSPVQSRIRAERVHWPVYSAEVMTWFSNTAACFQSACTSPVPPAATSFLKLPINSSFEKKRAHTHHQHHLSQIRLCVRQTTADWNSCSNPGIFRSGVLEYLRNIQFTPTGLASMITLRAMELFVCKKNIYNEHYLYWKIAMYI